MKKHAAELSAFRKQEQTAKVLRILHENKNGLSSVQIALLMKTGLPRNLLSSLQKQGLIKQKKGYSIHCTPSFIYVVGKDALERES